jgi:hypothetical protein
MITIHKFPLDGKACQPMALPEGAAILHVGLDPENKPCVWARVDPDRPLKGRQFFTIGTGERLPPPAKYHHGSYVDGPYIWHVFSDLP